MRYALILCLFFPTLAFGGGFDSHRCCVVSSNLGYVCSNEIETLNNCQGELLSYSCYEDPRCNQPDNSPGCCVQDGPGNGYTLLTNISTQADCPYKWYKIDCDTLGAEGGCCENSCTHTDSEGLCPDGSKPDPIPCARIAKCSNKSADVKK